MTIDWNKIIEDAIIGKLVTELTERGFRVALSDQDGGGLYLYAMPDNGEFPLGSREIAHWVRLVQGNGSSVISDYSLTLEQDIKAVNEFAAAFE